MILGIGIDLCRISGFRRSVDRLGETWIEELFTTEEQTYCTGALDRGPAFAYGFACKEACAKALGTGFLPECLQWRRKADDAYKSHNIRCGIVDQIKADDLLPWKVLDLRLACSLKEETGNETLEVHGRTDHRHPEGASGVTVSA